MKIGLSARRRQRRLLLMYAPNGANYPLRSMLKKLERWQGQTVVHPLCGCIIADVPEAFVVHLHSCPLLLRALKRALKSKGYKALAISPHPIFSGMMKDEFEFTVSKHGLPCLWEEGGGATNTGRAILIARPDGGKKRAIYVRGSGHLYRQKYTTVVLFLIGHDNTKRSILISSREERT